MRETWKEVMDEIVYAVTALLGDPQSKPLQRCVRSWLEQCDIHIILQKALPGVGAEEREPD